MTNTESSPYLMYLPCSDPNFPEPVILRGISITEKNVEQAGEAHATYSLKKSGKYEEEVINENTSSDSEEEDYGDSPEKGNFDKSKMDGKRKKAKKDGGEFNNKSYYEALGLGHLGFGATEKDIKSAHRVMASKYHPDKLTVEEYDETAKQRWLLVIIYFEFLYL
jgi:DnaJ domain